MRRWSAAHATCSAILLGIRILKIAFYVAVLRLRSASNLIGRALHLLGGAADCLTGYLLDFAGRFFGPTFDLIFVNAHVAS
jgi:hypothetical protein